MALKPQKVIPSFYSPDGNYTLKDAKLSVGAGWGEILEELWTHKSECIYVEIVKQKMGLLHVGFTADNCTDYDKFLNAVEEAIIKSSHVCEECGKSGRMRANEHEIASVFTLCDECAEKK